jgi:hypothetical protein
MRKKNTNKVFIDDNSELNTPKIGSSQDLGNNESAAQNQAKKGKKKKKKKKAPVT